MPPTTQEVLDGLADLQTAAMPKGWRAILASAHTEIGRLHEAVVMSENRLEAALLDPAGVCRLCVELAQSYLKDVLPSDDEQSTPTKEG